TPMSDAGETISSILLEKSLKLAPFTSVPLKSHCPHKNRYSVKPTDNKLAQFLRQSYNTAELPVLDPSASDQDSGESEGGLSISTSQYLNISISRKYQNGDCWIYFSLFIV
ncbi:MAG: hypothetical protein L3J57_14480, partial [Desulfuromusa sp.]|nr:hypothetical protein [Desulfuromusa sp.]